MTAASDSVAGLVEIVLTAHQIARVCDLLGMRCRRAAPTALACAHLAAASADLALEALTEDMPWTDIAAISRRARQLIEIQQLREQLSRTASMLERHRTELSATA